MGEWNRMTKQRKKTKGITSPLILHWCYSLDVLELGLLDEGNESGKKYGKEKKKEKRRKRREDKRHSVSDPFPFILCITCPGRCSGKAQELSGSAGTLLVPMSWDCHHAGPQHLHQPNVLNETPPHERPEPSWNIHVHHTAQLTGALD